MKTDRPTPNQLRVLCAVDACAPSDGWGEVFTHYDPTGGYDSPARTLVMRNFDRTAEACRKRGWLTVTEDELSTWIDLTAAGHAILRALHDRRQAR